MSGEWKLLSHIRFFATPWTWNSPGQNTGVGIFPTQELNPTLPCYRQILYQLSHQGDPRILEWVAYPFSSRASWPRNWIFYSLLYSKLTFPFSICSITSNFQLMKKEYFLNLTLFLFFYKFSASKINLRKFLCDTHFIQASLADLPFIKLHSDFCSSEFIPKSVCVIQIKNFFGLKIETIHYSTAERRRGSREWEGERGREETKKWRSGKARVGSYGNMVRKNKMSSQVAVWFQVWNHFLFPEVVKIWLNMFFKFKYLFVCVCVCVCVCTHMWFSW